LIALTYGAPQAHTPVLISSTQSYVPVSQPPFFPSGPFFAQQQYFPIFAPSPVFASGHGPIFVSAPGDHFINILHAAFLCIDPKSVKRY
jgi:hypothetical protein